jgi:competence protein ComEC
VSRICILSCLFAAGCLLGLRTSSSTGAALLPLLLSGSALLLLIVCWRPSVKTANRATAAFLLLGVVAGGLRGEALNQGCIASLRDGSVVRLQGTAATLPDRDEVVRLATAWRVVEGQRRACEAEVRGRASAELAELLEPGRDLEVIGRWRASPQRGTGWPRPAAWRGTLVIDSVGLLPTGSVAAPTTRLRHGLMVKAQRTLRGNLGERAGMAEALVLARRDGLDPGVREHFVAAGLAHLLAISGLHIGIIAGGVLTMALRGGLSALPARGVALGLTLIYVLLLGAPQPASRAVLQFGLLAIGLVLQRPADAWALLATAALVLMVRDPLAVLDAGVQLSFAGIGGLLAFRAPLMERLPRRLPRWFRDALAASIAASAATSPIAAIHFGQFAPIGILSSVVATPLVALLLPVLGCVLLLGAAAPALAPLPAFVADVMLGVLDHGVRFTAGLPGGGSALSWHLWLSGMLAALTAVLVRSLLREASDGAADADGRLRGLEAPVVRRAWLPVAAALAVLVLVPPLADRSAGRGIQIHAIDVGQGDAFAIRTPAGRWLLVDAGPRSLTFDAGQRVLVPYLLKQGARRIEAMVLTHPHADHVGGARAVIEQLRVGMVLDPWVPEANGIYLGTIAAARLAGVPWYPARQGAVLRVDGVELEVLHPVDPLLDATGDANDISVVLLLRYGAFTALLLGDASATIENALVRSRGGMLDVDMIKIGHHGSRFSTGDSLLAATTPVLAVIGVGRRNRYGHPAPEVLGRLAAHGVPVLRTDELGSFIVGVSPAGRIRGAARK